MKEYLKLLGLTTPMVVGLFIMGYTLIPEPVIESLLQGYSAAEKAREVWS